MKNNLWSFGCSFSEDFQERIIQFRKQQEQENLWKFYENKFGLSTLKSWQYYISEYLDLNANIYGMGGGSNYHIFESICNESVNFAKDDLVIIEWTNTTRTRIPNLKENIWSTITSTNYPSHMNIDGVSLYSESFFNEIILSRDSDKYFDELSSYMKLLKRLSHEIGFKLFFWSIDPVFVSYLYKQNLIDEYWFEHDNPNFDTSFINFFQEMGAKQIYEESDFKFQDCHFGQQGNEVIGDYFKNYIENKSSLTGTIKKNLL